MFLFVHAIVCVETLKQSLRLRLQHSLLYCNTAVCHSTPFRPHKMANFSSNVNHSRKSELFVKVTFQSLLLFIHAMVYVENLK